MAEVTPELAPREDSNYWYVNRELKVTKPGDIVVVTCVIGEKFGDLDGVDHIGKAAVFLGYFREDEDESKEMAEVFIGQEAVDAMSPEEVDGISRMPYFRADFEGIGELVFAGIECYWQAIDEPAN